jgi:hypothetical protein
MNLRAAGESSQFDSGAETHLANPPFSKSPPNQFGPHVEQEYKACHRREASSPEVAHVANPSNEI